MADREFKEYKPGASRYNGRISEDEWNKHKPKLRDLHEAKLTRAQILDIISKDFGDIKPTYGQLCTKFDKWGFHVYRINQDRKDTAAGKKAGRKNTKNEAVEQQIHQAFSPESSNGSTVVPDMGILDINDKLTPTNAGTPQTAFLDSASWTDTPRQGHSRNTSDNPSTPPLGTIYEPGSPQYYMDYQHGYPNDGQTQQWMSASSLTMTNTSHGNSSNASHGNSSSLSETQSSRTSIYNTLSAELNNVEPDDPTTITARTRKADDALDAVNVYLRSIGRKELPGDHIRSMTSLAGYLFATRAYEPAFRIYRKIYEIMCQDMDCNDISKFGALMRCYQSAIEIDDLEYMQRELHQVLRWNFSDSALGPCVASMLQTVETQISEGFNLAQVSILSTSSITRNLAHLMLKGTEATYPGTRRLYWRLRLLKHSPFHSGCKRLLRLMSELLSWALAAMAVIKFPDPALQQSGCLCKDGMYFDFVRMVTTVVMEAAVGFDIAQLIKLTTIKSTIECDCVMCGDLMTTYEVCPIETFIAIALLTVDRCRLDWTSCHPGGRHQELSPQTILRDQLLPTVEGLLDQVVADLRTTSTIHTSDLYDDFLSCIWSTFETHDLPLRNARFDASNEKVEDMMTMLITEEMNQSHPARISTLEDERDTANMPIFSYGETGNDELANKITAKRTRSNASSLKPSSSNASERSMIRIRKKLKFRGSADYLNSMSSYSSLSSRNSMNRFSLVTGLPELETMMEDNDFDPRDLPPDLTPDEFRSMQRHDSWSKRSDGGHFSWVPSRPGSTVSRTMSWRDSTMAGPSSRPGSVSYANSMAKRTSQRENPSQKVMHNQIQGVERAMSQRQRHQDYQPQIHEEPEPLPYANLEPPLQRQISSGQSQAQINRQATIPPPSKVPATYSIPSNFPQTYAPPPTANSTYAIPPNTNSAIYANPPNTTSATYSISSQAAVPVSTPPQQSYQPVKQYQITNSNPAMMAPPAQNTAPQPSRKNSGKSTKSKESTKGRWSSEQERVERILRMTQ